MRSAFSTYLQLGFEHIVDLQGYDHILFIVALCAIYNLKEWRKVAILITAFTIGHSLTLALAALNVIPLRPALIEFLIPVTIFLTAVYNVTVHRQDTAANEKTFDRRVNWNYILALCFGLIHGMGFSNFFRSLLLPGEQGELVRQLLAFNIGVEIGQLLVMLVILLTSFLTLNLFKVKQREWNLFISGAAAGLSLVMALNRIP